jgi:hypothetical protein
MKMSCFIICILSCRNGQLLIDWLNKNTGTQARCSQTTVALIRFSIINNYVWSRKYLGLYDYEAQEVHKRRYEIEGNSVALKDNDKLILIDEKMDKLVKGLP